MENAITDDELLIIEDRVRATTPGPWTAMVEGRDHPLGGDSFIMTGHLDSPTRGPDIYIWYDTSPPEATRIADLDFIAAARQDVERLIGELRRVRGGGSAPDRRS